MKSIYSYNEHPSAINIHALTGLIDGVVLYVPKGTKTIYENTIGWNEVQNIEEFDVSAVEGINADKESIDIIGSYSPDGKQLPALQQQSVAWTTEITILQQVPEIRHLSCSPLVS